MTEHTSSTCREPATVTVGSDSVYDLCCDICKEDGDIVEADAFCAKCRDYLCRVCMDAHHKNRLSRDHILQTNDRMPHKKPPPLPPKPSTRPCTELCGLHPDKTLEYYCVDDGRLACTICKTVNHRKCRQVDHISDLSKDLLSSTQYRHFIDTVDDLKTKSKTVIDVATKHASEAEQLCNNAVATIQEQRQRVNESFDKFIETNVEAVKSADLRKVKNVTAKGTTVLNEAEKIAEDLQTLQEDNDLGQLFIRMVKFGDYAGDLHDILNEAENNNKVTVYEFVPSSTIQRVQRNPVSIGNVCVQSSAKAAISNDMERSSPKNKRTLPPLPARVRSQVTSWRSLDHITSTTNLADIETEGLGKATSATEIQTKESLAPTPTRQSYVNFEFLHKFVRRNTTKK